MSNARFLLAKYVPDIHRMEPRNIGLFLWHKGHILTQFLPTKDVPFVNESDVYENWVEFWKKLVSQDVISAPGEPDVPKAEEACIDNILATQDGNYILVDAGFVPGKLSVKEMPNAVTYLFRQLVAQSKSPEDTNTNQPANFRSTCDSLVSEAGIEFTRDRPIECPVYGVRKHLPCNYFFGSDGPLAILQRARLSIQSSVHSAALTVHALTESTIIPRSNCRILVRKSEIASKTDEEGYALLSNVCEVVSIDEVGASDSISEFISSMVA